jgi:predicted acyl esterase
LAAQAQARAVPWAKRVTGYLRVRDGLLLKYSVLLPKTKGRFPAVLNYSGYDAGSLGGAAYRAGNTTMDAALDSRLLRGGYAVVGVNMRGTGCSQGGGKGFDLFSPKWGTDGYDAVEWIARQAWSNGAVGMANWSFAGLSQVFTAVQRPPHLKAIAPGMVVTDPWRDNGAPGGVPETQFPVSWWLYIQSRWTAAWQSAVADHDTRCLADLAVNVVNGNLQGGNPAAWSAKKLRPEGALNAERNLSLRASRINVPVLSMVAWQDESTGPRGGYYQDQLDPARTYLVATNGPHDSYMSTRFQQTALLPFFDHYLKGARNGFDKRPHVQLWMDSTGAGTDDASLQALRPAQVITRPILPVQVQPVTLALRSGGLLSPTGPQPNEVPTAYRYPGPGPDSNAWATSRPATGSVSFTTAPLSQTLTFEGAASLNLWVSTAAADADVQATITEVRPDGREVYVQRGWVRLSERAQDPARSSVLRPYPLLTTAALAPLTSTRPVLARLEIEQFAHTFRKGSSIRVWFDAPSTTGEWGFGIVKTPSVIQILHDSAHPSQLILGQLQAGGVTTPLPACGTVLGEPCRTNTLPVPRGTGATG